MYNQLIHSLKKTLRYKQYLSSGLYRYLTAFYRYSRFILKTPFPSFWCSWRNIKTINKLVEEKKIRIAFFDIYSTGYQFTRSTLKKVSLHTPILYIVPTKDHPAWKDNAESDTIYVVLLEEITLFLKKVRAVEIFVTAHSHIHPSTIRKQAQLVHFNHSMVSMHVVYGDDAFDAFTHFFVSGPHHVKEVESLRKLRQWTKDKKIYKVGYPKIDNIATQYEASEWGKSKHQSFQTILIAPSWHKDNILRQNSPSVIQNIISRGYKVIVRPHPLSHKYDQNIMVELERLCQLYPEKCILEGNNPGLDSLWQSDLMVSDWSGVAYEYAFATERPVLFIDTPRKINSVRWAWHGLPAMEDVCRSKIGVVIDKFEGLEQGLEYINHKTVNEWCEIIKEIRKDYLFNFKNSHQVATQYLLSLLK